MRDPRSGLVWSTGRLARRAAYCDYMASPQWFALRERWATDWRAHHGAEPTCLICGDRWSLERDDLHHRTYARLGNEGSRDLIPLCRICHSALHRVLECNPSWRLLGRAQATDLIVTMLHRRRLSIGGSSHKTLGHERGNQ
jgi:5-methylcytosine-specific restriction endonuclease McrA